MDISALVSVLAPSLGVLLSVVTAAADEVGLVSAPSRRRARCLRYTGLRAELEDAMVAPIPSDRLRIHLRTGS
jgi:hypothetical protein